jgi:hypothetical protein
VFQNEQVKVEVLSAASVLDLSAKKTGDIKTIKKLLSPISRQEVGTIRCIGLNYRDHAVSVIPSQRILYLWLTRNVFL